MSDPSVITRRQFIWVSAAVGGALVLGVTAQRLRRGGGRGGAPTSVFNAFVRIDGQGRVTVIVPKVEMGQGTYTSLPMLIAEELEVDLSSITVEPAPPNPAVYGFPVDPDVYGFGVDPAAHGFARDQSTQTSLSIIQCWTPLRQAGATARVMLLQAAAKRWGVPPESCQARSGEVIHAPSGQRLSYGALAAAAAALPLPRTPPLKEPKDFRLIGHPTARRDTPSKVNGSAVFGIDARPQNAKVALIAISPVEGGRIAEPLSSAAARAVRGVRQVVSDGDVVAVVADDTWSALQGMKALAPRWNDGANSAVQQAAIVAELEAAAREEGVVAAHKGDPASAAAHAHTRVEATYHQPFLAHATLEPMNCTLHWRERGCEIWTGTQAPDRAVAKLAALGLKPEQIRLHNHLIGGGFGRRLEVDGIVLAARVARHVRGPVRVLWSREQDIQHDRYRPYYVDRLSAALDARGAIVSWRHTIAGAAVSATYYNLPLKNGVDSDAVEAAADMVYDVDNMETRFVRHEPAGVPTGWWRGVGPTRSVFVVESFMDELAAAARQDPVEFRRRHLKMPRLRAVLDLAAERAGWGTPLPAGTGRGVSIQSAFGSYLAQVAQVSVNAKGEVRVERVVCAMDCGQVVNPDGVRAQLEGGAVFGTSAALANEITIADGRVQQSNFHDFPALRMPEAPQVETHLMASGEAPGGVGETGTSCVAAALCNAIYAATRRRVRTLPVSRSLRA
jgi:isoquinoline 1-oxidoreductase subunit beta